VIDNSNENRTHSLYQDSPKPLLLPLSFSIKIHCPAPPPSVGQPVHISDLDKALFRILHKFHWSLHVIQIVYTSKERRIHYRALQSALYNLLLLPCRAAKSSSVNMYSEIYGLFSAATFLCLEQASSVQHVTWLFPLSLFPLQNASSVEFAAIGVLRS
jgi:hypothetical protein